MITKIENEHDLPPVHDPIYQCASYFSDSKWENKYVRALCSIIFYSIYHASSQNGTRNTHFLSLKCRAWDSSPFSGTDMVSLSQGTQNDVFSDELSNK